jgi:hypothetical protein
MKKILFGLIATVMFTGLSFGQSNDPSNPKNEFDYVGKIHNEAMLEIINSPESKRMFERDSKSYCLNLLSKNNIDTKAYLIATEDVNVEKNLGKFSNNVTLCTQEQIQSWFDKKFINENVKTYLMNLSLITEDYYKNFDYKTFKSNVIKLEEKAYLLKNDDKVFMLSTASIARHTVSFWSNNSGNLARYTGTPRGLGLADLGGAVAGGIRTYVACFFTGPVGWGAWAGAIIGTGLGASAAYVIVNH